MKSYKKILAAVLSAAMLCTVAGCEKKTDDSSSESAETSVNESADSTEDTADSDADSEAAVTVQAKDIFDTTEIDADMDAVVMTINGKEVTLGEYRYYFLNLKDATDYGDENYWNGSEYTNEEGNVVSAEDNAKEKLDTLKGQVLTYMKNNAAVEIFAENNGVSLTDEEKEKSKNEFLETAETYKKENDLDAAGWQAYLDSIYCSEDLYIRTMERQALEYKNIRNLFEDDFRENLLPDYVMAKHILLGTTGADYESKEIPEGATDEEIEAINAENEKLAQEATDKLKEEKKALAEDILEKIKNGEDFDKLIEEYNEDPGEMQNEDGSYDGYLFTHGEMVQEFEDAAFALEIDAVSDIVETTYGYHILKRVPLTDEYLEENIIDLIMTNDDYYQQYAEKAQEILADINVEYTDLYEKINMFSLK